MDPQTPVDPQVNPPVTPPASEDPTLDPAQGSPLDPPQPPEQPDVAPGGDPMPGQSQPFDAPAAPVESMPEVDQQEVVDSAPAQANEDPAAPSEDDSATPSV